MLTIRKFSMENKMINILYVEDEIDHAILIGEFIKEIKNVHYEMTHVQPA